MFTPDMQNPKVIKPSDYPLKWNKISALAIAHQVMIFEDAEEELITDNLDRFVDWMKQAEPARIKEVLVEYFTVSSADLGWEGHTDLNDTSVVPVYDLLAADIMAFVDSED